jgi:hexosaminidase
MNWLGYQGHDMEVLIDFGQTETFSRVETNFFLDLVSWIFLPLEVRIEVSDNGKDFNTVHTEKIPEPVRNFGQKPVHFSFSFPETRAKFLKITAISHKTCPDWHRGAGQPAWLFIDELVVE